MTHDKPTDRAQQRRLIERYLTAYRDFDIDAMLALLTDDVRFENHEGERLTVATDGREAFAALARQSAALFAEREQRVTRWDVGGDSAVIDIAFRGLLAVDIPDGPRAGSLLQVHGHSTFAFREGRISGIVDRS